MIQNFLKGCETVLVVEEGEPYLERAPRPTRRKPGWYSRSAARRRSSSRSSTNTTRPSSGSISPPARAFLHGAGAGRSFRCAAATFETADPVRGLFASGHLLRGPQGRRGPRHRVPERHRLLHPRDYSALSMAGYLLCMGSSTGPSGGFPGPATTRSYPSSGTPPFHSGIPGLVNAVFNNHDLTLVILDNGITAMTGHQPNPAVDMAQLEARRLRPRLPIEAVVRAIGVPHVTVIKPYKVTKTLTPSKKPSPSKGCP